MTALIIIGIIALIITLIMLIPVGADVGYEGGEISVSAKVCGILVKLFPKPPEDGSKPPKHPKKEKKSKKKDEQPEGEQKPKRKLNLSFTPDEILGLLKKVLKGFGKLGRKFKVERFLLRFTAAGDDPYNTAMMYGYVNTALSSLGPICQKRFSVDDCEVVTAVDFTAEKISLDFGLTMTIRIGQIFGAVNTILFGALGILIKNKLRLMKEKRHNKGGGSGNGGPAEKNIEETDKNTQAEERMAKNG